jgi:hypothetical protein
VRLAPLEQSSEKQACRRSSKRRQIQGKHRGRCQSSNAHPRREGNTANELNTQSTGNAMGSGQRPPVP